MYLKDKKLDQLEPFRWKQAVLSGLPIKPWALPEVLTSS